MKHKVGDQVRIKSREWYDKNKGEGGDVLNIGGNTFVSDMSEWCGKMATIKEVRERSYRMDIDDEFWSWNDEMFEDNNIMEKTLNITIPEGKKPKITEDERGCVIEWLDKEKSFEDYAIEYMNYAKDRFNATLSITYLDWPREFKFGLLNFIANDINEIRIDWSTSRQDKFELFCVSGDDKIHATKLMWTKYMAVFFTSASIEKAQQLIPVEFLQSF